MGAQLAASQTKIAQLRSSIADLAEENGRNIVEVEKRGLGGAVRFAKKLREELRSAEDQLRDVRSAEAGIRARVGMVASEIERLEAEKEGRARNASENGVGSNEVQIQEPDAGMEGMPSGGEAHASERDEIGDEDEAMAADDEEFQNYVLQQGDDADRDDEDSEEGAVLVHHSDLKRSDMDQNGPTDESCADGKGVPSGSTKSRHSTEIVVRPHGSRGFLPLTIWEILKRIVGLGKEAVHEVEDDFRRGMNSVMIV